ncbi:MAG: immunoglobulin domain-containing protein [Verrucomicrobiales bacterium]|nr:immunoglobulin domain-containing protein [Verrucomicrobiales bacterium]
MRQHSRLGFIPLVSVSILGACLAARGADYPAKVLSHGPLHYWRLNDQATVPVGDRADNQGSLGALADGFYVGAASHPVAGAPAGGTDTAVALDAVAGTAVTVPYLEALNPTGAFTVEAWLNPNAETTTAAPTCALSSGQFASPRAGWLLYQVDNGWNFRMYNQNGTSTSVSIVGGGAPVVGDWYHVVAVYDGTTAFVYVNGVQVASAAPTGYVPGVGGALFIGGRSDSSFWWNGTADEVAIYGKALSAADVDAHYKSGTGYAQAVLASAPLAYYRLGEGAYTAPSTLPVAVNAGTSGASGDGAYNPGMDGAAAGPRPPGYSGFEAGNTGGGFNGTAGFVGTPATLNDLAQFTVTGWIRRGAIHSGRGGYFGQNDLLEFGDADSGANIEAWINAYGTNIKVPFPFRDQEWGFIALVGDGASATLYTNGVAASTVTQTVENYGTSAFNFNIGGGGIFNTSGDPFLGGIDEVAVFDKALTGEQLQELYFAAGIAPVIVTAPQAPDRNLFEGNAVLLSVAATGTPPLSYQWRKGGAALDGKTEATLSLTSITLADAGSYDVVVSNAFGTVTSGAVVLTVKPADRIAPTLSYAAGTETLNGVRLWFSEPLDPVSAQSVTNYVVSDGLTVVSAALAAPAGSAGDNIVILTTSAQTAGKTYQVTINNVKDQAFPANSVAADSKVSFSSWVLLTGYLKFEHYDNISGAADSDLQRGLSDARVVAGTPTTAGFLKGSFDTRTLFVDDSHEAYLARMTGWITPTETGEYYFFLKSDDAGRLYLSTNETIPNPASDTPICIETGCCGAFMEPESGDAATTATPITLQAGRRYGVMALLKEGGGGDFLQIAWRKSTDSTEAASLPPLPGAFLSAYADPNVDLAFTKQPTDQGASLPSPVVGFASADFTATDGGYTVENTATAPPGPWGHAAGTGWSADGGESACTGPYNTQLKSPGYVVPKTEEVTLTFTHRYSFEGDYWDAGQVRLSVNGGAFAPVNPDNFTANGYATGVVKGSGVLKDQRAFNGDSPGYAAGTFITSTVILGAFQQGDTLAVEFVGAWDECTTASVPGWVIQNVKLEYGKAPRASTFEAEATALRQGTPSTFSYQWQRNDGAGFVDIAGATAASYRLFPVAADLTAQFRVVISVPGKSITSSVVKLVEGGVVVPEVAITRTAGGASIAFTGTLESASTVEGPYTAVAGATSPYAVPTGTGPKFFRSVR